jgi:hypothetical protein
MSSALLLDVHPTGKTGSTHHTHHVNSLHMTTFHKSLWGRNGPLYPEEILVPSDRPARPSSWVPHSSSLFVSLRVEEKMFGQVVTKLLSLLGPYHQHAINTFNTCSWVPTTRSLTDTDRGYNLGGADFPHHSPHPSQLTALRFPLMAPSGLQLIQLTNQPTFFLNH